jgi:rod shape-determining protein MreC
MHRMKRSSLFVPGALIAASCLLLALPSAWTDAARFVLLGLVRSATESPGPPPPPPPSDDPAEPIREQNQILAQRLARLQEENAQLRAELTNLKDFRRVSRGEGWELLPAPIPVLLARDPSSWNRTLLISRGSDDGVSPEDPVVWGPRFIGRVHKVNSGRISQVRLVTDRGFRTPVVVSSGRAESTPTEPLTGILEGQGLDTCALQWIMQDTHIEVGWPVLTMEDPLSNTPPHLLVGRVSEVEPQAGPFLRIRVRPAIRFSSLSQVYVYKKRGAPPAPAAPPSPAPAPPGPRRTTR